MYCGLYSFIVLSITCHCPTEDSLRTPQLLSFLSLGEGGFHSRKVDDVSLHDGCGGQKEARAVAGRVFLGQVDTIECGVVHFVAEISVYDLPRQRWKWCLKRQSERSPGLGAEARVEQGLIHIGHARTACRPFQILEFALVQATRVKLGVV